MTSQNKKIPTINPYYFQMELFLPIENQEFETIEKTLTFIFSNSKFKSYFMKNVYVKFLNDSCKSPLAILILQKFIDVNDYSVSEFATFFGLIGYSLPNDSLQKILNDFYYSKNEEYWFNKRHSKPANYTICSAFIHDPLINCYSFLKDLKLIDNLSSDNYSSLINYCLNYNNLNFLNSLIEDKKQLLFKKFILSIFSFNQADTSNLPDVLTFFYNFCSQLNQKEVISLNKIMNNYFQECFVNLLFFKSPHLLKNMETVKHEVSKIILHQELSDSLPSSYLKKKLKI